MLGIHISEKNCSSLFCVLNKSHCTVKRVSAFLLQYLSYIILSAWMSCTSSRTLSVSTSFRQPGVSGLSWSQGLRYSARLSLLFLLCSYTQHKLQAKYHLVPSVHMDRTGVISLFSLSQMQSQKTGMLVTHHVDNSAPRPVPGHGWYPSIMPWVKGIPH